MYKDGKECVAETDQVDAMKKAGWSVKPNSKTEEVEETTEEVIDDTSEPKKTVKARNSFKKKPVIKKTSRKINSKD
jgi:hypothetical protein